MAESIQIGSFSPTEDTRLGRMLAAGRVTATMRSKRSGEHVTLTLHAMAKKDNAWQHVLFAEASHVFIKQGDGKWGSGKVGTYYPKNGKLFLDTQDSAWKYAAIHTLGAARHGEQDTNAFTLLEASCCGVCGRELTDPVSIERGIGPTCVGALTGSKHYHAEPKPRQRQAHPVEATRRQLQRVVTRPQDVAVLAQIVATDRKGRQVPRTFEALAAAVKG